MARPFVMSDAQADPKTPDFWRAQIKAAQDKRQPRLEKWRSNIDSYLAKSFSVDEVRKGHQVWVPLDYANTEQKKAQLMFRVPEVQLTATRPQFTTAVPVFQAVLNHYLGRHGVDARTMLNEALFDAICPAGLAVTMIGYEPTVDGTKAVVVGYQPVPNVGDVLSLQPVGQQPIVNQVPNVIHEQYFWVRCSPEKALIPSDFHGSNYDLSPWLGVEFELDRAVALRKKWITDDTPTSGDVDPKGLNQEEHRDAMPSRPKVSGVMLFYRMAVFGLHPHPEAFGWCVLIDGREDFAVKPSPSPWQKFVPDETGKLRLIGLKGNPIHIKGARYVSDTAYPPSDVQMGRPQVEEMSKFRTQLVRQRDRNVPIRGYDKSRVDKETIQKIEKAEEQALIGFDGNPNEQLAVMGTGQLPRENFEADKIIKQDLTSIWAMGANQRAQDDDSPRKTATEASIIEQNADTRLAYEQDQWLDWFVRGAEKLGGLLQLFADDPDYVEVVGEDGLPALQPWDKTKIAGEFVFSAVPDTNIRQDATTKRKRALDQFQILANEPHINRAELVRWLIQEMNLPPKVYNPQPPDKGPDALKAQLTMRDEGMSPAAPAFPVLKAILEQLGLTIPDDAIAMGLALQSKVDAGGVADPTVARQATPGQPLGAQPQTMHPGPAEKVQPLDKRSFDMTGQLPGAGQAPAVN